MGFFRLCTCLKRLLLFLRSLVMRFLVFLGLLVFGLLFRRLMRNILAQKGRFLVWLYSFLELVMIKEFKGGLSH